MDGPKRWIADQLYNRLDAIFDDPHGVGSADEIREEIALMRETSALVGIDFDEMFAKFECGADDRERLVGILEADTTPKP